MMTPLTSVHRALRFPIGATVTLADLTRDPYPLFAQLQRDEPVSWIDSLGMWYVTRRVDVLTVLLDPEIFTVQSPHSLLADTFGRMMLGVDGAEHRRFRQLFSAPFQPRTVRALATAYIEATAHTFIEQFATDGHADLMVRFINPLALATVTTALGLPVDDFRQVRRWYDAFAAALANYVGDPSIRGAGHQAAREFGAYIAARLDDLPADSILAVVRHDSSHGLTDAELIANTLLTIFGGLETTAAMLANTIWALLRHPALFDAVRSDPEQLIPPAIEEALRWESPVQTCTRHVTRSTLLNGVALEPGETVQCVIGAANRDPAFWAQPEQYDLARPNAGQHLAFAHGKHFCIGAALARLEGVIGLRILFERLPQLRLDPQRPSAPQGHEFRAPATLDVVWH